MDRYEEALERAKKGLPIDEVFPELKESEDERIRKGLLEIFNKAQFGEWGKLKIKDIIAWLEKQKEQKPIFRVGDYVRNIKTGDKVLIEQLDIATKIYCYVSKDGVAEIHSDFPFSKQNEWEVIGQQVEQKPAEWSEEDERTLESFLGWLQGSMGEKTYSSWLKSLPERFSLKPKQEWSEEDKMKIVELKTFIAQCNGFNKANRQKAFNMIDALRPSWKPSKEQIEALNAVANEGVLLDLFNDLLKLL